MFVVNMFFPFDYGNPNTILSGIFASVIAQNANTSRACGVPPTEAINATGHDCKIPNTQLEQQTPHPNTRRQEQRQRTREGNPQLLALREGEAHPAGYKYLVRETRTDGEATENTVGCAGNTMDVSSTPPYGIHPFGAEADTTSKTAMARRNANRNINKKANVTFAKEMKESLA